MVDTKSKSPVPETGSIMHEDLSRDKDVQKDEDLLPRGPVTGVGKPQRFRKWPT